MLNGRDSHNVQSGWTVGRKTVTAFKLGGLLVGKDGDGPCFPANYNGIVLYKQQKIGRDSGTVWAQKLLLGRVWARKFLSCQPHAVIILYKSYILLSFPSPQVKTNKQTKTNKKRMRLRIT